ncbi:MAG: hypothetical protein JWM85_1424 [Acidimicrobiaceae bacterium]|nr:hypothetical protein [Acidimicrobiaceae bacterium]
MRQSNGSEPDLPQCGTVCELAVIPLYDVLVALHALVAVVGFGALAATGAYASALRRSGPEGASAAARRYFAPGRNLAPYALFAVPALGVALLGLHHWHDLSVPYPWVGLVLWVVAAGLATGVSFPAEREIKALLAESATAPAGLPALAAGAPGPGSLATSTIGATCKRCERATAAATVCFVIALFFMVVQPR